MFERDDIDLVSVCVSNFLHHDVVSAAAKGRKDCSLSQRILQASDVQLLSSTSNGNFPPTASESE